MPPDATPPPPALVSTGPGSERWRTCLRLVAVPVVGMLAAALWFDLPLIAVVLVGITGAASAAAAVTRRSASVRPEVSAPVRVPMAESPSESPPDTLDESPGLAAAVREIDHRLSALAARAATLEAAAQALSEDATEAQTAAVIAAQAAAQSRDAGAEGHVALSGAIESVTTAGERFARSASTVSGLRDHSREVADVVSLIQEIAAQSKVLALNAAIEAASVGDSARGLAVVAREMRALAVRTDASVGDVRRILAGLDETVHTVTSEIDALTGEMRPATEAVEAAGERFDGVIGWSQELHAQVDEIAASARRSGGALDELMEGVEALVAELASVREETGALARVVTHHASFV